MTWILILAVVLIALFIFSVVEATNRTPEQANTVLYGNVNRAMICPHCSVQGKIRTKPVIQKKGVSGGKATAAVLTAGVSLLATGLSRKEASTQAHCENCQNTWYY